MEKITILIKNLESILKIEEEELREALGDSEEVDILIPLIEKFEAAVAKLLRSQRKYYIDSIESFTAKNTLELTALFNYLSQEVFPGDTFEEVMEELMVETLTEAIEILTALHMKM